MCTQHPKKVIDWQREVCENDFSTPFLLISKKIDDEKNRNY